MMQHKQDKTVDLCPVERKVLALFLQGRQGLFFFSTNGCIIYSYVISVGFVK